MLDGELQGPLYAKWTRRARDIEINNYGSRYEIINNGCAAVMAGDASITSVIPPFPLLFLCTEGKFTSPAIRHFDPHTQGSESGLLFFIFSAFRHIYLYL